jgi:hypothetical protein
MRQAPASQSLFVASTCRPQNRVMGEFLASCITLRAKIRYILELDSIDKLHQYPQRSAVCKGFAGTESLSARNDGHGGCTWVAASISSHCQELPVPQGYCAGMNLQFVRVIVTTELRFTPAEPSPVLISNPRRDPVTLAEVESDT